MTRPQAPFSLEYILLGYLFQAPIHGYDLYKKITQLEAISLVWHIKQNQLYALLDKLKGNGLLTSSMMPGESYPIRKEYKITSTGRRVFLDWATSPVKHGREMRQEFLAKLYFAQQSGLLVSLELIEEQKAVCTEWLVSFEASLSKLTDEQYFEKILFSYRLSQTQAMLAWLDDSCIEIQTAHTRLTRLQGINPQNAIV